MRLSPEHVRAIRTQVADVLGGDAQVRLFGSRTNDQARGGDIDLHVTLPAPVPSPAWATARLSALLERKLDGRQVDVRLWVQGQPQLPVDEVALHEGIAL